MEFVGYKPEYREDVISCLKRNFRNLSDKTDEYICEWIKPMTEYKWEDDIPDSLLPYKHGMVLIDGERVVGYCGMIYSYLYIDGKKYIYANPTTWAIDSKYRIYVLKATKEILKTADIFSDFSAIGSMEEMNRKTFKYEYLDTKIYKFLPIPKIGNALRKSRVVDENMIEDSVYRLIYKDHYKYDVKCCVFQEGERNCYVFYRKIRQKIKIIQNIPYVQILGVSDSKVFSANLKEIVWHLQKTNFAFLEMDSRFVDDQLKNYKPHKISPAHRQIRAPDGVSVNLSNLYSEMAINKQIR